VLISVAAERQIGQLGREPCVLDVTEIVPSGLTSPCTFVKVSAVVYSKKEFPLPPGWMSSARSFLNAR